MCYISKYVCYTSNLTGPKTHNIIYTLTAPLRASTRRLKKQRLSHALHAPHAPPSGPVDVISDVILPRHLGLTSSSTLLLTSPTSVADVIVDLTVDLTVDR